MAIFCPLADEVGKLSDWISIGVGCLAAGGTIWVAWQAKATSDRATDIADDAKTIANQQHQESVANREGVARILGSLLTLEIAMFPTRIGAMVEVLDDATISTAGSFIGRSELNWLLAEIRHSPLATTEAAQDRLHNLPGDLGNRVAELIAMWKALQLATEKMIERIPREAGDTEIEVPLTLKGENELSRLRLLLLTLLGVSISSARQFTKFVESDPDDYSHEESVLNKSR